MVRSRIRGIGITNQRETTVIWDKTTGKPLYNALVWLDTRTKSIVDTMIAANDDDADKFREACGLPITTYFSALKIKWLIANVPAVREAVEQEKALFGSLHFT